jgi:hypothetical protein
MFCLSDDGKSVTCEPHKRLAHLTEWFKEALHRPGSTFSIWLIGRQHSGSGRFFGACIPEKWAASVQNAKKDFLERARAGAAGSKPGVTVPARCHAPGLTTPGRNQLVVSPEVSPLPPDIWQQITTGSAPQLLQSAIVCDRSPSTNGVACTPGALLQVFDRFVADGRLLPGSSLSVEMVGPLQDALQPFYHLRIPELPVGERIAYALSARVEISRLFAGRSDQYASTIAEAISAAVRRLREHTGAYRLTVLSDMLQISPGQGGYNFEKTLPAPKDFVAYLKKQNLAADLRGIPVLICGLHTGHYGQNSQAYATRLHDLWQAVLQMMGAPEVKFFSSCDAAFAANNPRRNQS